MLEQDYEIPVAQGEIHVVPQVVCEAWFAQGSVHIRMKWEGRGRLGGSPQAGRSVGARCNNPGQDERPKVRQGRGT